MRLFAGELMAPILLFDDMFVSEVSLAFFEDSGWYAVNYGAATTTGRRGGAGVQWGVGQGCDFAMETCIRPAAGASSLSSSSSPSSALLPPSVAPVVPAGSPPHFCASPGAAACTYDLRGKGSCVMVPFPAPSYPSLRLYMYFRDATSASDVLQAGFLSQADYCPLVVPADMCTAAAEQPAGGGAAAEVYGSASRCFLSTLRVMGTTNGSSGGDVAAAARAEPACYAAECSADALALRVSARGADGATRTLTCLESQTGAFAHMHASSRRSSLRVCPCIHPDLFVPFPGSGGGGVICPPLWALCGIADDPCDAFPSGSPFSGTTLAIGLAAAAAVGFAALLYTPVQMHDAWRKSAPERAADRAAARGATAAAVAALQEEAEAMRVAAAFRGGVGEAQEQKQQQQQQQQRPRVATANSPWGDDDDEDDGGFGSYARRNGATTAAGGGGGGGGGEQADFEVADDDTQQQQQQQQSPPPHRHVAAAAPYAPRGARGGAASCCPAPGAAAVCGFSRRPFAPLSLLPGHPLAVLVRSVAYALSYDARNIAPGAVVHVRQYLQTQGWGAAEVHLELSGGGGSTGNAPKALPPPPPLSPGAGWAPPLARRLHPGLYTVTNVGRDARGAPLYRLGALDFQYDFSPAGGAHPGAAPTVRRLALRRAWGGAAGAPPALSAATAAEAAAEAEAGGVGGGGGNAAGAATAAAQAAAAAAAGGASSSLYGAFSGGYTGGYTGGASAAVAEALKGWTPYFYREHLAVPPLREVPPSHRPAAALAAGFAAAPGRRLAAALLLHGPVTLLLCALETSSRGAALQRRCATPAWRFIVARGAAAAALTAAAAYAARWGALAAPQRGIELLPRRVFWPALIAAALASAAAAIWAAALNYSAASGGLALPVGPASAPLAGSSELAGLCASKDGGAACGADALRRILITWGAAVACDQAFIWPLLLLLSEYAWRDGVARPEAEAARRAEEEDEVRRGAAGAYAAAGGQQAASAFGDGTAAPPQQQRDMQRGADADGGGAWGGGGGGAWGGGDDDDDDDDGGAGVGRTWRNPTFGAADAPSAPPAPASSPVAAAASPSMTRAHALRVESAWG
jgi:hypothetical protein